MYENSIIHVKDCNSTGLDKIPVNSIILNKATGEIFQLTDKTGILNTTKFRDIVGKRTIMSTDRITCEQIDAMNSTFVRTIIIGGISDVGYNGTFYSYIAIVGPPVYDNSSEVFLAQYNRYAASAQGALDISVTRTDEIIAILNNIVPTEIMNPGEVIKSRRSSSNTDNGYLEVNQWIDLGIL